MTPATPKNYKFFHTLALHAVCPFVRRLVCVGGGTGGWLAAGALAKHFQRSDMAITLVESSAIGTIGVGEATIPTLRRFYARLGMTDMEVMRAKHATAKLGISFEGWDLPGSRCLHPFGLFGQGYSGLGFPLGRADSINHVNN